MDVNVYGRQLDPAQIDAGAHRDLVGGLWETVGALQLAFLQSRGLQPGHRLLDVGCGALRGGLHFVRYLEPSRYCGLDVNASLLAAGRMELAAAGLDHKDVHLLADDRFDVARFGVDFDCAIAVSVFTHLPMNHILRCLIEVRKVLQPQARFFASYFEAPGSAHLTPVHHTPGDIVSHFDADPYHYALAEMQWMAQVAQLAVEPLGEWGHPRGQRMLAFSRRD